MRILITNHTLANRAGSELYVRDLALGLLERGHEPIAYSTNLGEVAQEIREAGIPVTDDLDSIVHPPDIIHGHHHLDTMTALLRLPATPAIFVCHGSTPWQEAAPLFPRIRRYVAVDHACRDRLFFEHAIPAPQLRVIFNFVDLKRFKTRTALPSQPRRALIFSNQANEQTHLPAVRTACERAGIEIEVIGIGAQNGAARPEDVLGNYDLVFAKGRSAIEALAVGNAVVLCDAAGAGPMVTTGNVQQLRPLNFGFRSLTESLNAEVIGRELDRYDSHDAMAVSDLIRATAGRDEVLDELLALYQEVIDEHSQTPDGDRLRNLLPNISKEQRAAGAYLRGLAPRLYERDEAVRKLAATRAELESSNAQLEMIRNSRGWRLVNRVAALKQRMRLTKQ